MKDGTATVLGSQHVATVSTVDWQKAQTRFLMTCSNCEECSPLSPDDQHFTGPLSSHAGYTPLHMAVGYSHVAVVAALLDAGANPEVQDRQSRDVIALVESIREKMPISPEWMGKRMALEQVISLLGSEWHGTRDDFVL